MTKTRRVIGWSLVGGSLLTHAFTVWCYARQPDTMAAFTVLPFWFWGGIGLILSVFAFCLLRAPLSLTLTAVWAITLAIAMDEAQPLTNLSRIPISTERSPLRHGFENIRVASLNCAEFRFGDPIEDLKKWDPDIVLLQEVRPHRVKKMAEILYPDSNDYRAYLTNGIITRYEIRQEIRKPGIRNQQATLRLPSGREIEVVNVHLAGAATDLRLWSSETRIEHRKNRAERQKELSAVLQVLEQTSSFPNTPTILGGDFNASSSDVVHRQLSGAFEDTFAKSGRGWGNTFHRRFPILRIDHIYATRQFRPVSSGVIISKHTDHRMVISDLTIRN